MAKGQKRSNREVRKPKADRSKTRSLPPIDKAQGKKPAGLPQKT